VTDGDAFFAQHFAGTAYLKIVHGEEEAAAELLHRLNRFQSFLRLCGKTFHIVH